MIGNLWSCIYFDMQLPMYYCLENIGNFIKCMQVPIWATVQKMRKAYATCNFLLNARSKLRMLLSRRVAYLEVAYLEEFDGIKEIVGD